MNLEEKEEEEEVTLTKEEAAFAMFDYEMVQEIERKEALLQLAHAEDDFCKEEELSNLLEEEREYLNLQRLIFSNKQDQQRQIALNQMLVDNEWKELLETTQDMQPMDKLKAIAPNLHKAIHYTKVAEKKEKGMKAILNKMKRVKGKTYFGSYHNI